MQQIIGDADAAAAAAAAAKIVAFYLPQYHRVQENDEWWGQGFTDWTNVRKAKPLFHGHNQPRIPADLGYYDLADPDIHFRQAELAKSHRVSAFCYYVYWFSGRRILERPLDLVRSHEDLEMPYLLCWANEPWSRRWDGSEEQVLIEQTHSASHDAQFIEDVAEHLAGPRYVRIQNRPVLLVYRAGLLDEPLKTTDAMRERALRIGLGEIYLGMVQSFGHWDPISYGFDGAIEFPPHNLSIDAVAATLRQETSLNAGSISGPSYDDVIRVSLSRPVPSFDWFRGVMPDWDNTSRRGMRGTVYVGSTPSKFQGWVEAALESTYLFHPPGERLIFVNAWNEWAEAAYLEPDEAHGDAYLQSIQHALERTDELAIETARLLSDSNSPNVSTIALARAQWTADRPWMRTYAIAD